MNLDLYQVTWFNNTEDYWWLTPDHEFLKHNTGIVATVKKVTDPVLLALHEHDKPSNQTYVT